MKMDSNAYYHSRLGVRLYDLFSDDADVNGPVKGDLEFYVECAKEFGAPVLEVATGTGRVLWPIAKAGFDIVGIDISDAMLAMARTKGEQEDAAVRRRVRLHQADMTSLELKQFFPLAIIPFRAFQHLILPEQQRDALNSINRSLVVGGHLILDVFDPRLDYCVPGAPSPTPERRVRDEKTGRTGVRRVLERINDPVRQILTERFRLEELNQRGETIDWEESEWTLKWAPRQEMRYLFRLTGFEVVAEYSDFFRSPPAYGKEQLWVLRKA